MQTREGGGGGREGKRFRHARQKMSRPINLAPAQLHLLIFRGKKAEAGLNLAEASEPEIAPQKPAPKPVEGDPKPNPVPPGSFITPSETKGGREKRRARSENDLMPGRENEFPSSSPSPLDDLR